MKHVFSFCILIALMSCSQETDSEDLLVDFESLDPVACDCPPPGVGGGDDDNDDPPQTHVFENYQFHGKAKIDGYDDYQYGIVDYDLFQFNYGINLGNNGEVTAFVMNSLQWYTGVRVIDHSYNLNEITFFMQVLGTKPGKHGGSEAYWTTKIYTIDVSDVPAYRIIGSGSGVGGNGGGGVFPYSE